MSRRPAGPRRAAVELGFNGSAPALPSVAGRALHQYWSLLAPHFRGIFLPPQWRADGTGVAWSWREPATPSPLTSAELATVRKRLAGAQRSLADAAESAPPSAGASPASASLAAVQACTAEIAAALAALPDPALAAYAVRTESGNLLHSWGLGTALTPFFPDAADYDIGGTVCHTGRPAPHHTVLLENSEGRPIARATSDAAGRFSFPKNVPGRYRVRVDAAADFPPEGVTVEIQRTSVTDLELHDRSHRPPPSSGSASASARSRRRLLAVSLPLALVLLGAGAWWWTSRDATPPARPSTPAAPPPAAAFTSTSSGPLHSAARPAAGVAPDSPPRPRPALGPLAPPPAPHSHAAPPKDPSFPGTPSAAGSSAGPPAATHSPGAPAAAPAGSAPTSPSPAGAPPSAASSPPSTPPSYPPAPAATAPTPPPTGAEAPHVSPPPPPRAAPKPPPPNPASSKNPPPSAAPSPPPPAASASRPDRAAPTPETPPPADSTKPQVSSPREPATTPPTPPPPAPTDPAEDPVAEPPPPPPTPTAEPPPDSPSPAPEPPALTESPAESPGSSLDVAAAAAHHHYRFRLGGWQTRLLRDEILPTLPRPRDEADSVDALRTRRFAERRQQLPADFRSASVQRGFALELPAPAPSGAVRWRDASGHTPPGSTVSGPRAEFAWSDTQPPPPLAAFTLVAADGQPLATLRFDADGHATLATIPAIRAWPWLALPAAPAPSRSLLDWQILAGLPAPATWRTADDARRLDLIAPPGETGRHQRTLAVVDPATGWALVTALTLETEAAASAQSSAAHRE